ncbi:alpha/beta fold hydrolase, partial [Gordonia rhizosphera]
MNSEPRAREWTETVNGTGLRVEEVGAGDETLVFSSALFTNRALFDAPVAALCGDHRCIRYDHRGQGDSGLGAPQPSTEKVMTNMFGTTFMSDPTRNADREKWRQRFGEQLIPEAMPMLL